MDLSIEVRSQEGSTYAFSAMNIPDCFIEAFEPLRTTDGPVGVMFGDVMRTSDTVERKVKLRENSAEKIAEILTAHLIDIMKSQDTHNGYKITNQKGSKS